MSQAWYVFKDGLVKGPFTREQLARQTGCGMFGRADMVWTNGMVGWTRADQVEGLLPPDAAAPPSPDAAAPPPPPAPAVPSTPGVSPSQTDVQSIPGAAPYQQGAVTFPLGPADKQNNWLLIIMAVILVGIVAISGFIVYYIFSGNNGNGDQTGELVFPESLCVVSSKKQEV